MTTTTNLNIKVNEPLDPAQVDRILDQWLASDSPHRPVAAQIAQLSAAMSLELERSIDPVVEANRAELLARSNVGIHKYGVTLAGAKLSESQLLTHALQESLDLSNYIRAFLMRRVVNTVIADGLDNLLASLVNGGAISGDEAIATIGDAIQALRDR